MKRLIPLAAILALLTAPSAFTASSATKLAGTTGPGFTITVKKSGAKVTKLRAGKYTLTVSDKSAAHNFVLTGPGIKNKQVTGLAFKGTKTVTVTLKKGRYEYYCTPHRSIGMHGFIKVT
ncbi:MAG TPA: plastocyanin/azurin family copper-binding protein [Gaiellaceae bacterium]|jgi:plastocyanin|nr:plastocyanin/azurin family copper-binding protein [Gaiellaceae bacterium]